MRALIPPLPIPLKAPGTRLHGVADRNRSLLPLLDWISPMIDGARHRFREEAYALAARLGDGLPFEPEEAEMHFYSGLPETLLKLITPVLALELNVARLEGLLTGGTPEERFTSFVARISKPDIRLALLNEYPVLASQVRLHLNQWLASSLELLTRLSADWNAIRHTILMRDPGKLIGVTRSSGDRHKNGRSVSICEFSNGDKLVYKPRSLAVDAHFRELLAYLNTLGFNPAFRLFGVLDGGDYGWTEFVSSATCTSSEQVERFYVRQGGYLALLYALEACDFHCENLLAAGEYPMLLDLEALFHHSIIPASIKDTLHSADLTMGYSVMKVGLLPQKSWAGEEGAGLDISGFGGEAGQSVNQKAPFWENVATDEMCLVRRPLSLPSHDNRPTLRGAEVNALDYCDSLTGGFRIAYQLLLRHRKEFLSYVERFADDEVRVIARPTRVYARLLHESYHPDVLRRKVDRDALFDKLHATASDCPELDLLVPSEERDLWNGDIPFFSTRPQSRSVRNTADEEIQYYLPESGLDLVTKRVESLSEADLDQQLWITRASLATLGPVADGRLRKRSLVQSSVPSVNSSRFLAAAMSVGDWFSKRAIHSGDRVSWLGLSVTGEKSWMLAPLSTDLYDGLPGVAFFLAYLGSVSGEERYSQLARACVETLLTQVRPDEALSAVGAFSGWGGIIYVLAHMSRLWADESLGSQAIAFAGLIPTLVSKDAHLDVIGGAAGCILALTSLHEIAPSSTHLGGMLACGDWLLAKSRAQATGMGWTPANQTSGRPLTGFAHGNAGIAGALLQLAGVTGLDCFKAAAVEAIAYERSLFSEENANWPDLRFSEPRYGRAWCHGAPGIALARLRSLCHLDDAEIRREIDAGLQTTSSSFGCDHALCHGDLGLADILLEAGLILNNKQLLEKAQAAGSEVLASIDREGWICSNPLKLESPGLMTGLAGIGYGLLRLADPLRTPSVLALAPPAL